jgi:hypothetical protein
MRQKVLEVCSLIKRCCVQSGQCPDSASRSPGDSRYDEHHLHLHHPPHHHHHHHRQADRAVSKYYPPPTSNRRPRFTTGRPRDRKTTTGRTGRRWPLLLRAIRLACSNADAATTGSIMRRTAAKITFSTLVICTTYAVTASILSPCPRRR